MKFSGVQLDWLSECDFIQVKTHYTDEVIKEKTDVIITEEVCFFHLLELIESEISDASLEDYERPEAEDLLSQLSKAKSIELDTNKRIYY